MSQEQEPEIIDQEKSTSAYIAEWGPDLLDKWQSNKEMLGLLRTAHFAICQVRELQSTACRQHAVNAFYGNVSPDMSGVSPTELLTVAETDKTFISHLIDLGLIGATDTVDYQQVS